MKIEASRRLNATLIIPNADFGTNLKRLTDGIDYERRNNPKAWKLLGSKDGLSFYREDGAKSTMLACVEISSNLTIGYIRLEYQQISVNAKKMIACVPTAYMYPSYQGRGLILGMYQYALTQFNLLQDKEQTKAGNKMWIRLISMYQPMILQELKPHTWKFKTTDKDSLKDPMIRMLIMRR